VHLGKPTTSQGRAERLPSIQNLAGRQGFEPWVELLAPQPLSRRPQSSTLAPPRDCRDGVFTRHTIALHYTPSFPHAQIQGVLSPSLLAALASPHCSQPSSRGRVMSSTLAHSSTSVSCSLAPLARSPRLEGVLCQAPWRIGAPPYRAPLPPLLAALVSRACYVKHPGA
jgi:hypothetical protein